MRQSFKLFFRQPNQQDDIRRVKVSVPPPTWEEFLSLLEQIFGDKFHPELSVQYRDEEAELITVASSIEWEEALSVVSDQTIVKIYVTEHANRAYFKDSAPPRPQGFYEKSNHSNERRPVSLPSEYLRDIASNVPKILEGFFKKGKILPHNIPAWLQDAVKIKHVGQGEDDVELDVDVDKLYKILLDKAIALLNDGMYDSAKNIFQQMLTLNRNNPLTLYNLACAESLKGEVKEAIGHLREAIENGYSNVKHLLEDPDLDNLKFEPDFDALLNQLKIRLGFQAPEPQEEQVEEQQRQEEEEQEEEEEEERPPQEEEWKEVETVTQEDFDDFEQEFAEPTVYIPLPQLAIDSDTDSDSDSDSNDSDDDDEEEEQPTVPTSSVPEVIVQAFEEPKPAPEIPQYSQQLQQLIDMGFTNIETIENLLAASDGNVDEVLSTLLDGFEAL